MTLIIKILSVIGIILLILLAIILMVIVFPRKFYLEYTATDSLSVKMNLMFFKIRLFPLPNFVQKIMAKKKEKPAKSEKETEKKSEDEDKKSPFNDIQFSFELVKQILSAVKGIMKRVIDSFKFSDISFTLPVEGKDAFDTQQKYSNITTAFYAMNTFLQRYVHIYYDRPIFVADFAGQYKNSTYFYMKITASPLLLIFAGAFAFKQYRLIMKNNNKQAPAKEKEI